MRELNIFVLDDDDEELELIQRKFDEAGIVNYTLYSDVDKFLANLHIGVHVAVIDHFIGAAFGMDIMDKIYKANEASAGFIRTKVLVVSGQTDVRLFKYYTNHGAVYLDKNHPDFYEYLIFMVKKKLRDIETLLDLFEAQLKRLREINHLFEL